MMRTIFTVLLLVPLCIAAQKGISLENITLIDVEKSEVRENQTVLINNAKITEIFDSSSRKIDEAGYERMDMSEKYLIPGLIDGHVHLFANRDRIKTMEKLLESGITSVRDMGGDARAYKKLNSAIESDSLIGPAIFYSANFFGEGFMEDPRTKFANKGIQPGKAPWMRLITSETNIPTVVREAKGAGVTGIKMYASLTPELMSSITTEAHKQGLMVWSHSSVFPSKPSDAVAAGVDVLSHSVGIIGENSDSLPDTFRRGIQEFIPNQDFDNTSVDSAKFDDLMSNMKKNNTILEPTISSWKRPAVDAKPQSPQGKKGPPRGQMNKAMAKLNIPSMIRWMNRLTARAYEKDLEISAGTDFTVTIKWVQDEVKFLTEAGVSQFDALRAATIINAKVLGIEKTYGSISAGKMADLVVLNDNPIDNISNLKDLHLVIKNGIIIEK